MAYLSQFLTYRYETPLFRIVRSRSILWRAKHCSRLTQSREIEPNINDQKWVHSDSDYLHVLLNISWLDEPRITFHPSQERSVPDNSKKWFLISVRWKLTKICCLKVSLRFYCSYFSALCFFVTVDSNTFLGLTNFFWCFLKIQHKTFIVWGFVAFGIFQKSLKLPEIQSCEMFPN